MSGKDYLDRLGLSARLNDRPLPPGVEVVRIPVSAIDGDPLQPRKTFNEQELDELAESLNRHGQIQPITVRRGNAQGRYIVVAGERRLRASRKANRPTIDAIVLAERVTDQEIREQQLVENLARADLAPMETAQAYRRMLDAWGCSQAELARRLAVSPATVSRALALLEAPAETQARIAAGESVRQVTSTSRTPRKRTTQAKPDKRRAIELELASGFVRVKRGATLEQLVEDLRETIRSQGPRQADAA